MAKNIQRGVSKAPPDQLPSGGDPKTALDSNSLVGDLKKALAERVLNAETDIHLAQEAEPGIANHCNGSSDESVLTLEGTPELSFPRDRHGRFAPALIGFDDKIIELYTRGMSTPNIQHHVRELYGLEISADLVSAITDSVLDEVAAWQARQLEPRYAIVFFDALRVKIGDEGSVKNRAVYVAIGLRPSGHKHVLGLWIGQTEGARFWLRMMNEIKSRGTQDILIAVIDGLKGFAGAITAVFPNTVVQTCIVHLIRYSMQFAYWKQRKPIASALKAVYRADNAEAAAAALDEFDQSPWGRKYPAIAQNWRRNWKAVIPFFALPSEVRKIIYTTHAIETLNAMVRKAVRNRGHFPNDQAATKLIWLALRNITVGWRNPPISWHAAKVQLAIEFEDRFVSSE